MEELEAKLQKLKVVDLRHELDKRGLSKTGLKAELVSRLMKAMKEEDSSSSENDENAHPNVQPSESKTPRKKENTKKDDVEIIRETPASKSSVEQKKTVSVPQVTRDSKVDNAYVEWLKLVDQASLESALKTVCQQVHPNAQFVPSAIRLLRNYLYFVSEQLLKLAVLEKDGKRSITSTSVHKALDIVYPGELAKHAWSEAAKAQEVQQENNGLVFPKDLLRNLIVTKYATSGVEDAAVVGLSAILEYTSAELIELAGRTTEDINITGENVRRGYSDDEELTRLLRDYKCPIASVEQYEALEQWKPLAGSLFQVLEKLPTEELSAVLRQLVGKAHLIETVSACKDILQAFVEEVEDEQTASEIRQLSKVVNFKSSELIQQKFEHFLARTKKATFNIDGISFEYCNTAPNINQTSVDTTTVMRVLGKPESNLNGNLWELVDGQRYVFSRALMHHIKKQLDIKMTDARLTKFLLCIGEVESGGSWGLVESELEAMAAFFTPEGDIAEVSNISVPSASLSMDMAD